VKAQAPSGKPQIVTVKIIALELPADVRGKEAATRDFIKGWANKRTGNDRVKPQDILLGEGDQVWVFAENTALHHKKDHVHKHFDKSVVTLDASNGDQVEWVSKTPFAIAVEIDGDHPPQSKGSPPNPFGWEGKAGAKGSSADGYRLLSGAPKGLTGRQRYKAIVWIGETKYDPDLVCVP
jgi:hypothetical protein